MFQVTIFGGHDGRLRYDKWFYLTLFGGVDLVRPTIAHQLIAKRQAQQDRIPIARRKPFFLTIFGAVDIKSPTLAAEFIDLKEMLRSEQLTLEEWDRAVANLGRLDPGVASFTLFGGFDECGLPSENEEVDSLATQRHLGNIPESAGQVLQYGIGHDGAERHVTLGRAIRATA